jgi:hypothetical protein
VSIATFAALAQSRCCVTRSPALGRSSSSIGDGVVEGIITATIAFLAAIRDRAQFELHL